MVYWRVGSGKLRLLRRGDKAWWWISIAAGGVGVLLLAYIVVAVRTTDGIKLASRASADFVQPGVWPS